MWSKADETKGRSTAYYTNFCVKEPYRSASNNSVRKLWLLIDKSGVNSWEKQPQKDYYDSNPTHIDHTAK